MAKTTKAKVSTLAVVQETEVTTAPVQVAAPPATPAVQVAPASLEQTAPQTANDLSTSGRVKWFNNKAGYGFITVTDCETSEERDIFVHHSEINVDQSQYKYLVQGEYVEFVLGAINRDNAVDVHATHVRGINGGKLMCETRNEARSQRTSAPPQARQTQSQTQSHAQPRAPSQPKQRIVPQLDKSDQAEWMVVPRRRTESVSARPRTQPRQRQPQIEITQ